MALADIIKKVIDMLPQIAVGVGVTFVVVMLMLILGGGIKKQADDGNIPVSTQTVTAIGNAQANLTSAANTVTTQTTTAVNYLPLIIIMAIALGFLGFLGFKALKSKGGNAL